MATLDLAGMTIGALCQLNATGQITPEQLAAELDRRHKAELAKANAKPAVSLSAKISEKGAVSVYGLGRFPVTLYREQWERLRSAYDTTIAPVVAKAQTKAEQKAAA